MMDESDIGLSLIFSQSVVLSSTTNYGGQKLHAPEELNFVIVWNGSSSYLEC